MLCAVIPTLNSHNHLPLLLQQLAEHVDRIVVSDGGSSDATLARAVENGAVLSLGERGRGGQLARGARWSHQAEWLLFVHCDCQLPENWPSLVAQHIQKYPNKVGYFRYGADSHRFGARFMEFLVGLRCFWLKLPYGDQGLLISRQMYDEAGGYKTLSLFEDVEFIRRLRKTYGRSVLRCLPGLMKTDIAAYEREGIWRRGVRNIKLIFAYNRGEDVAALAEIYRR